jgi:FAS-associated factor 2
MTTPEIDISQLTELQRDALEQYTSVTAQAAGEAIPILQRSQWNVQVCYASVQPCQLLMID